MSNLFWLSVHEAGTFFLFLVFALALRLAARRDRQNVRLRRLVVLFFFWSLYIASNMTIPLIRVYANTPQNEMYWVTFHHIALFGLNYIMLMVYWNNLGSPAKSWLRYRLREFLND